mgnify:CR=1 FL=1|jgi:hypothetical protein
MKFVAMIPGRYGNRALVELTELEFGSLTGKQCRLEHSMVGMSYDVNGLRDALFAIARNSIDIKRTRASMQAFLDLTEDAAILAVLEKCGVPVVVQEPVVGDDDAEA